MGDGPRKKPTSTSSVRGTSRVTSPAQGSIRNYFAPLALPPEVPTCLTPQSRTPNPHTSNQHTVFTEDESVTVIPSHCKGYMLFLDATMGWAIDQQTLAALAARIPRTPGYPPTDDLMRNLLGDFPIWPALRRLRSDYNSIPNQGYCTLLLIDELIHGRAPTPNRQRRLHQLINRALRTFTDNEESQIPQALRTYREQLRANPTALAARYWMHADLLPSLLRHLECPHTLWMSETPLLTPFSGQWMPLTVETASGLTETAPLTLDQLDDLCDGPPHIGHSQSHHFHLTDASVHMPDQIRRLLCSLREYLTGQASPPCLTPPPEPTPRLPGLHAVSSSLLLYLPQRSYRTLARYIGTLPARDIHMAIADMLMEMDLVCCAHRRNRFAEDLIPRDGFCASHTLDFLTSSHDFSQPWSPNPARCSDTLNRLALMPHATLTQRESLRTMSRRHTSMPSLPRAQWPSIATVAQWSNLNAPTALWEQDDRLPSDWIKLTYVPTTSSSDKPSLGSRWSTAALRQHPGWEHVALADGHFSPCRPDLAQLDPLLDQLIQTTTEHVLRRRHESRALSLTAHTPCPADPGEAHHCTHRVTFAPVVPGPHRTPLISVAPPSRPLDHPALVPYEPPPEIPLQRVHRRPRHAHRHPRHPATPALMPPPHLFTLNAPNPEPDLSLIGPATAPGSYYAAYARDHIPSGTLIGIYTNGITHYTPVTDISDPQKSTGDYAISIKDRGHWYEADAHIFDSCHMRFVDEAETEDLENCRFTVHQENIWIVATADIPRYAQLLARYGHQYWCHPKWPLRLLRLMFSKYGPTLTMEQKTQWFEVINQRTRRDAVSSCPPHRGILRYSKCHPVTQQAVKVHTPMHNRRRKQEQVRHRREVQAGRAPPQRGCPRLQPNESTPPLSLTPHDWIHTPIATDSPKAHLTVMSWSCQGRLFAYSNIINSGVRQFLHHVIQTMRAKHVDIMWLNDARFTAKAMDPYISIIQELLPGSRVIQFPTTYIRTGSRNPSFNQMGGTLAIVTFEWHGYITRTIPDPTGSGLINAIDLTLGNYAFRTINVYLLPTTSGEGPATLHTRLQTYITGPTAPQWARSLDSLRYQLGYLQKLLGTARLQSRLVILVGDLNRVLSTKTQTSSTPLSQWMRDNHLQAPCLDTLHRIPGHHTWNNNSPTQNATTIDHILLTRLPPSTTLTQLGTVNDPPTAAFSDHRPIWLTLGLLHPVCLPSHRPRIPVPPRADICLRNDLEVQQYNQHLATRLDACGISLDAPTPSPRQSCSALAVILRHSALSVMNTTDGLGKSRKITIARRCSRPRGQYKNGYSPQMRQIQAYLYFYTDLLRTVFSGTRRPRYWATTTYAPHLRNWISDWHSRYYNLVLHDIRYAPARSLPKPDHLLQLPFAAITRDHICQCRKSIKTMLHGTHRMEMRHLISEEVRHREHLRNTKQLGQLIQALDGTASGQLDLHAIPCPHKGQITDPVELQQHLNAHFTAWYALPPTLDPAAIRIAKQKHWWHALLTTAPNLPPLHHKSRIPVHFQRGLQRVLAEKVTEHQRTLVHRAIEEPITFADFDRAINDLVGGGAGGISEVTSNMVKAWSTTHRRIVYNHMSNIWTNKVTPTYFKDKLIKLAPKLPGIDDLDNMRPISLYEITRKAWTNIVGKRLHEIWHQLKLLHPSQHGYRLDSGTSMALHTIVNEIEDAYHLQKTKYLTFWDIKRAFDSIAGNLQRLSWMRLGVPRSVADWLVGMDEGGQSYISSPYYHQQKHLHTPEYLAKHPDHFTNATSLAFTAERGIGQGESASSLLWTALYDILLEWIDPSNRHLHQDEPNLDYTEQDIQDFKAAAYADDLATCAGGENGQRMQQIVTNWLSAFCSFAGLVIHPKKVIATTIGPTPLPPADMVPRSLLVHDLNWKPFSCHIDSKLGSNKYLGVQLDLRHTLDSHGKTLDKLNCSLSHLAVQPGSPDAKAAYIQFKLLPQILATATCANWTLKQYRTLDVPLSQAYRLLLGLSKTFPAALLYLPKTMMGIGIPRLSDKAQVMKWEALTRSQAVGGIPASAVNALFGRLPSTAQTTAHLVHRLVSPPSWPRRKLLVRSLLQWFTHSGLTMAHTLVDPETLDPYYSDNRSLVTLAKELRLHPCINDSDEDNENLPLIRLVCTDGSFNITPRGHQDILNTEEDLGCIGTGAGGIVFLPPGYDETKHTPNAVRITCPTPLPGMNAFAWELVTQLIALHFTRHMPMHTVHTSDCTSAIARTNRALSTVTNQLANTRGGIFASDAHQFSNPLYPRQFIHTYGHPERDAKRTAHPTIRDKAITIADAVAAGRPAKLGATRFPTTIHTLLLTDILPTLIPPGHWHLRMTAADFPLIGDILPHQHRRALADYTSARDQTHDSPYWSSSAYGLAHKLFPLRTSSILEAAYRTCVIFDKHGHGRNRAKEVSHLPPDLLQEVGQCRVCPAADCQTHCMLDCTYPPLDLIRGEIREAQAAAYHDQVNRHTNIDLKNFARQLVHASWTPSSNLARIWFGLWNEDTIRNLLGFDLSRTLSATRRRKYIKLAAKLTAPLRTGYSRLVKATLQAPLQRPNMLPHRPLRSLLRNALENTYPQVGGHEPTSGLSLRNLDNITTYDNYTLNDAACCDELATGIT